MTTTLEDSNKTIPTTCLSNMSSTYFRFCDVERLWGVIAVGASGMGILLTFVALFYYISYVKYVVRNQASKNIYILLITLFGCFTTFIGSLTFVLDPYSEAPWVCLLRRWFLLMSWPLMISPILVLCTVTWAEPFLDEIRFCSVLLSTISIIAVNGIIVAEWCILKPPNQNFSEDFRPLFICEEYEHTYPSSMSYNYFIILATIVSSIVAYHKIKNKQSTHNSDELGLLFPTLFLTSTIVPCLAGWAFMVLFGLEGLSKIKDWWEPTNAFFMVVSGTLVLVFYIFPVIINMRNIKKEETLELAGKNIPNPTIPDLIERNIPMSVRGNPAIVPETLDMDGYSGQTTLHIKNKG